MATMLFDKLGIDIEPRNNPKGWNHYTKKSGKQNDEKCENEKFD